MSLSTITGIDIGTHHIKVVIANGRERSEINNIKNQPKVLGVGMAESRGMRHGYVVNMNDVTQSIKHAINEAEKRAQTKVKKAFISIGGIGLGSIVSSSYVIISRADSEITPLDIKKLQEQSEKDIPPATILNKKIIHSIPIQYKVDGKAVLGKPLGMKGSRFEMKTLYITSLEQHLNDIIQAAEEAGVSVQDVMAAPLAASLSTLNKSQKIAGCVLANIGSETVSIIVFENNIPISLEVFPIGSTDITNDIALGLKVPLEEAEQIKIGAITGSSYPRKKLEEIVYARLFDIFELIEAHLKKIGRNGLLPAGIILTGNGANLSNVEEVAKSSLRLPSRLGIVSLNMQEKGQDKYREKYGLKDSTWTVAYGLCVFGTHADEDLPIDTSSLFFENIKKTVTAWVKQFLP